MVLSNFEHVTPDVLLDAAETLGGMATGRYLALNAMENRVYDVELEGGENVILKFYRPGRWSKETILAEHKYLKLAVENEIPVVTPVARQQVEVRSSRCDPGLRRTGERLGNRSLPGRNL